jgi:Fur family transcriptional regulator, ferric uptake regulator
MWTRRAGEQESGREGPGVIGMDRHTTQRNAIRRAFEATGRPLGPKEVHGLARRRAPGLGVATVYRNIAALVEEGWLVPVALPGEPPRYEMAGKHHHHHFHCRRCGGVFEIEGCPGNLKSLVPRGFRLESHDILLGGLCRACG